MGKLTVCLTPACCPADPLIASLLQAAHEVSDADDGSPDECMEDLEGTGGMQVSPSSPSIQEKQLKAASQPSNTNGNTSGSNESDGSKRRQGTTQGEGSNPTSVKDSNTATQTNGCSGAWCSVCGCMLPACAEARCRQVLCAVCALTLRFSSLMQASCLACKRLSASVM